MNKEYKLANNFTIKLTMDHEGNNDYYKYHVNIDTSKYIFKFRNLENLKEHTITLKYFEDFINKKKLKLVGPNVVNGGFELSIKNNILTMYYSFADESEITSEHLLK